MIKYFFYTLTFLGYFAHADSTVYLDTTSIENMRSSYQLLKGNNELALKRSMLYTCTEAGAGFVGGDRSSRRLFVSRMRYHASFYFTDTTEMMATIEYRAMAAIEYRTYDFSFTITYDVQDSQESCHTSRNRSGGLTTQCYKFFNGGYLASISVNGEISRVDECLFTEDLLF